MSVFDKLGKKGGKGKGKENEAEAMPKAPPRKKKSDLMSAVLNESVIETVMDDFINTPAFTIQQHGEPVYLGMFLRAEDIGGLSKKAAKDEDKGGIIEAINSNRMSVLLTADLLEQECLIFVCSPTTLEAMYEYELLEDAPYRIAVVHRDGSYDVSDAQVTLQEIRDVSALGGEGLDKLIDGRITYDTSVNKQEDFTAGGGSEPEDESPPVADGMSDVDIDGGYDEFGGTLFDDPVSDPDDGSVDVDADGVDFEGEDGDAPEEEAEDVPEEAVMAALDKRFYSEELDLQITTEGFDQHFGGMREFQPFVTDRGEGWINEYLSRMSQDANSELQRMHTENWNKMREQFLTLIEAHCGDIVRTLDIHDENTRYGQIYQTLLADKEDLGGDIAEETSKEQMKARQEWEDKLRQVGEDAFSAAQHSYRERFEKQHEDDLGMIPKAVRERMEAALDDKIRSMHDRRRVEAKDRLALGVAEALVEISRMYEPLLEKEQVRYEELNAEMAKFRDDNRKDEIKRIETLGEELKQTEKADKVAAEYTARIRQISADAEAKRQALAADLREAEIAHSAAMQTRETEHSRTVATLKSANETLRQQTEDLMAQIARMDEAKNEEFRGRMGELEMQRDSANEKYNHLVDTQKRSNFIVGLLCAVAVVAAVAVGFVAGEYASINSAQVEAQNSIVEAFNSRMDELQIKALYPEVYEEWQKMVQEAGGTAPSESQSPAPGASDTVMPEASPSVSQVIPSASDGGVNTPQASAGS